MEYGTAKTRCLGSSPHGFVDTMSIGRPPAVIECRQAPRIAAGFEALSVGS